MTIKNKKTKIAMPAAISWPVGSGSGRNRNRRASVSAAAAGGSGCGEAAVDDGVYVAKGDTEWGVAFVGAEFVGIRESPLEVPELDGLHADAKLFGDILGGECVFAHVPIVPNSFWLSRFFLTIGRIWLIFAHVAWLVAPLSPPGPGLFFKYRVFGTSPVHGAGCFKAAAGLAASVDA